MGRERESDSDDEPCQTNTSVRPIKRAPSFLASWAKPSVSSWWSTGQCGNTAPIRWMSALTSVVQPPTPSSVKVLGVVALGGK